MTITPLRTAALSTPDQTNAIAEALWGIAAAITESKPKAPQLTLNRTGTDAEGERIFTPGLREAIATASTTKTYGPSENPDAFRPALELLPIGAVAELDEPIVLDGPKAKGHFIPSGTRISRVEKHRHELTPGYGSGFELHEEGGGIGWAGTTNVVLEMGLSARDFSVPKGELEVDEVEDMINEPDHYKLDGRECIEFTRALPFVWGNVVKYVWRFRHKNGLEDLHKARRYLEIAREESIRRPESSESYKFFRNLFFAHDGEDEVGKQRLYVLRQVFIPTGLPSNVDYETVETELDELIDLVEGAA